MFAGNHPRASTRARCPPRLRRAELASQFFWNLRLQVHLPDFSVSFANLRRWHVKRVYLFALCIAVLGVVAATGAGQGPDPKAYLEQSRAFSAGGKHRSRRRLQGDHDQRIGRSRLVRGAIDGVTTGPVRSATEAFLKSLDAPQRAKTVFPVNHVEWRMWANRHLYFKRGFPSKTCPRLSVTPASRCSKHR